MIQTVNITGRSMGTARLSSSTKESEVYLSGIAPLSPRYDDKNYMR